MDKIPAITITRHRPRTSSRELLNLMTGELIHPEISVLIDKMQHPSTGSIQYYPDVDSFMTRISRLLNISQHKLTLAAGSDLLISVLIDALSPVTKHIILQYPIYPSWSNYASLRKMHITVLPFGQTKKHAFYMQDMIETIKSSRPALVVVVNPHSPTGFCFSEHEMLELAHCCHVNGHFLVIDECYIGFSTHCHRKLLESSESVILVKSFSKSSGIAGARIALALASEKITHYLSHWNTDLTVSGHSLHVFEYMLQNKEKINAVNQDIMDVREQFIKELLAFKPHWKPLPSSTNFVVIDLCDNNEATHVVNHLKNHGIRIGNLSKFIGLEGCIKITIAHWDIMKKILDIFRIC